MVAITSGKVLVTGASGYIGAWVVKYLVEHNFAVRVATRNDEQAEFIENRFPEYKGKVSHVNVPNIEAENAYDEAVKDVDAIIHCASPVVFSFKDPSEIINPAIAGATGILKSAHKSGYVVKRVLITGSGVAIHNMDFPNIKDGTTFDEASWNTVAHDAKLDKDSSPWLVYNAAKTRAEKAAWEFVNSVRPSFDLVTILPTFNWGPFIHKVGALPTIGSSPGVFLSTLPVGETSGTTVGDWVDVRDTAELHVLALETPALGGERLATTNGLYAWQDIYDVLNAAGYDVPGKATKGAGAGKVNAPILNTKTFKFFPGFKYRSFEESVTDMAADLKAAGLLQ
ncbi:NAD(P)-binding protein [Auriscalpium vulgare]|uniref:NAD(P)-binding protein n=1 Tax=Auriscalpium vulgare TaxID=40419 RepID=A0ACB8R1I2_9AGAM|nr:NAD(P)-binding protein [Auriscalpium vulgare]